MALAHELFGTGDRRVVVLNDFSQDTSANDAVRPYLDREDFTFAFLDVRGYGRSKGVEGAYDASEIAADVIALADALGWDRFHVLGHSMSAMGVQRLMADHPSRLLAVVATTPVPATSLRVDDETLAFFQCTATDDDAFRMAIRSMVADRLGAAWAEVKLALNRDTVAPRAMQGYCRMFGQEDFAADVEGCTTPILVVYGRYDGGGLDRAATEATFRRLYPNLEVAECDSGHYPMQETPIHYAALVQDYLRS